MPATTQERAKETVNVQLRVPKAMKQEADEIFENMGIDIGTAFRAFLVQAIARRGMPFEMVEPKDPNGFSPQHVKRLMRAKTQIEAGEGQIHDIIEVE